MSEFKREERYIVLKLKNMYELERKRLDNWLKVNDYEEFKTECVVVESGWPIYEDVWDMVQRLAEGREQKIAELQTKLADSEARVGRLLDAAKVGVNWMRRWLEMAECECEYGHTCGYIERKMSLQ